MRWKQFVTQDRSYYVPYSALKNTLEKVLWGAPAVVDSSLVFFRALLEAFLEKVDNLLVLCASGAARVDNLVASGVGLVEFGADSSARPRIMREKPRERI